MEMTQVQVIRDNSLFVFVCQTVSNVNFKYLQELIETFLDLSITQKSDILLQLTRGLSYPIHLYLAVPYNMTDTIRYVRILYKSQRQQNVNSKVRVKSYSLVIRKQGHADAMRSANLMIFASGK